MNHEAIAERIIVWLEPTRRRLRRATESSYNLRLLFLVLGNLAGVALMLAPLLTIGLSTVLAFDAVHQDQGPLNWMLFGIFGAASLFSGYLSVQFYLIRTQGISAVRISDQQAPELFDMLERQASEHRMHPIDQVMLTLDPELRIEVIPKGLFPALHEYTLVVGAPLLFFLSPAQFRLGVARAVAETARER